MEEQMKMSPYGYQIRNPNFIFRLTPYEKAGTTKMAFQWYDEKMNRNSQTTDRNFNLTQDPERDRIESIRMNRQGIWGELAAWGILGGSLRWLSPERSHGQQGADLILFGGQSVSVKTTRKKQWDYGQGKDGEFSNDYGILIWPVDWKTGILEIRGWFSRSDWYRFRYQKQLSPRLSLSWFFPFTSLRLMRHWPHNIHDPPRHFQGRFP